VNHLAQEIEKTWYLKDEPVELLGEKDMVSHRAYVNLLAKAIVELNPPFTLGLFGSWGVGKTSIVDDLREQFNQDDSTTKAVTIDVGQYQCDPIKTPSGAFCGDAMIS